MTMEERRTRERLRELANGGWDKMDPLTRQCLGILADSIDEIHKAQREAIADVRQQVGDLRKTMIGLLVTILVTVVASQFTTLFIR